jgi:hypothetical protein
VGLAFRLRAALRFKRLFHQAAPEVPVSDSTILRVVGSDDGPPANFANSKPAGFDFLIKTCAADADAFAEAADAHGSLPYTALAFTLCDFRMLNHLLRSTGRAGPSRGIMRVRTGICWSGLRLKGSLALGEAADRGEARHQPGADFHGFDPTSFDEPPHGLIAYVA